MKDKFLYARIKKTKNLLNNAKYRCTRRSRCTYSAILRKQDIMVKRIMQIPSHFQTHWCEGNVACVFKNAS